MNKWWINPKQIVNKQWTSCEQIMNKSWTSCEKFITNHPPTRPPRKIRNSDQVNKYNLFMNCPQLVDYKNCPDLFTTCSWFVHNLFMTSSQLVHDLFTTCSRLVHVCSRLVHNLFTTCSWFVHNLFMNYSTYVPDLSMPYLKLAWAWHSSAPAC